MRGKRSFDVVVSLSAIVVSLPILLLSCFAIWVSDRRSPLYVSQRIGRYGVPFRFVKVRTMVHGADRTGVDTTARGDSRVLMVGQLLRAAKLDELPQFWHVLRGEMSIVGPRPNVPREVALYTDEERRMLAVLPGITDVASIVFSDLADVVGGAADPNLAYNQFVRPWKSRLALHCIGRRSLWGDLRVMFWTLSNAVARRWTLERVCQFLRETGAPPELVDVAGRTHPLMAAPPPGAATVVTSR